MGIEENHEPNTQNNEDLNEPKNFSLNNNNIKNHSNGNKIQNINSSFSVFCAGQDIINIKKKTEIDLTMSFSSAKGTYTKESYKLFSDKEKNFFYLVQKNNISGIRYLIIQGVNINILDEERTSPLHIACKESSIQTIEELIFQGSMINIPDLVGWTPLHMACYYNRPDVVLLLLKSGANYNTHNREKLSARDLAIKCGNYNCAKVLDNFIKYQQIEKEKCLKEIHNKENYDKNENNDSNDDNIYEEILKKYILYQKLKNEFLQNNEDILSNNNDYLISEKNEDNDISDIVNDEFYPTAQVQKNYNEKFGINEIEKCLHSLNLEMIKNKQRIKDCKDKYNLMFSKYKFIPKKHRFYLKYEYKNGKFMVKSKNQNKNFDNGFDIRKPKLDLINNKNNNFRRINNISNIKNDEKNLIHVPHIPPMIPLRNLNRLHNKFYTADKIINNNKKLSEEEKNQIEEEAKIYKTYDYGDEEDVLQNSNSYEDDEINFEALLNELNNKNLNSSSKKFNKDNNSENGNSSEEDADKTISLEDEEIYFHCENFCTKNHKDQKILLSPFNINRNPDKELVKYFLEHNDIYEELLQILFHFDYVFGLQFLMSISDINNSIISLINFISSNIFNSRLRLEILNLMNYKNKSTILESYFSLLNTQNNSIFQNIKKIFKIFDLTTNDIRLIDQLSFSFSKIYYQYNKENSLFKSQNSIYFFVFTFIIIQLTYNQSISNSINEEKLLCDMLIMLKNLNEGKNYDNILIKESIKEIKKNNEPIIIVDNNINYEKKLFNIQMRINKDNKLMTGFGYFKNGIFIVFNNKKEIIYIFNLQIDKNISCNIVQHFHKICFTSLQNKIVEIINKGNTLEFQKTIFFEVYIQNNNIINDINKFFQDKRNNNIKK